MFATWVWPPDYMWTKQTYLSWANLGHCRNRMEPRSIFWTQAWTRTLRSITSTITTWRSNRQWITGKRASLKSYRVFTYRAEIYHISGWVFVCPCLVVAGASLRPTTVAFDPVMPLPLLHPTEHALVHYRWLYTCWKFSVENVLFSQISLMQCRVTG